MIGISSWVKATLGPIIGVIISYLGGSDVFLSALCVLMILDATSGLLHAAYEKRVDGDRLFKGAIKRLFYFIVIAAGLQLDIILGAEPQYVHTALTGYFILEELVSVLNHARVVGAGIPKFLTDLIEKLRQTFESGQLPKP